MGIDSRAHLITRLSGTGRTENKVRQTYFCRCGTPQNKQYCDDSHTLLGRFQLGYRLTRSLHLVGPDPEVFEHMRPE